MSNVLIGIIGVILFIGLALAGALILGDDFKSSSNETKSAALMAQLQQASQAIDMYEMKTGSAFNAGTALSTIGTRFLKSVPQNPTGTGAATIVGAGGEASGVPSGMVVMALTTNADDICKSIAQTGGNLTTYPTAASAATLPTTPSGCFKTSAVIGALANNTYYAYSRT